MFTKFKLFENDAYSHIIPFQGKLDLNNVKFAFNEHSEVLNKYLLRYYIINEKRPAYFDEIITDKNQNILFGKSVDKGKFNYTLNFRNDNGPMVFDNNKTSKCGLVDETGINILVNDEYDHVKLDNGFWILTTGKELDEISIANRDGKVLMKKNGFFDSINVYENRGFVQYKLKNKQSYEIMNFDEFFSTNWELKILLDKYNI